MSRTTIRSVAVEAMNIPLLEPFTIATGSVSEAQNVLITITLNDGSRGYGECAPFNPSTGVLSGTPAAGSAGVYTLHFTNHNCVGSDITQVFTLTVIAPPTIIPPTIPAFTVGTASSFKITTIAGLAELSAPG